MDYWGEGEVNGEDPRTKEVTLYNPVLPLQKNLLYDIWLLFTCSPQKIRTWINLAAPGLVVLNWFKIFKLDKTWDLDYFDVPTLNPNVDMSPIICRISINDGGTFLKIHQFFS